MFWSIAKKYKTCLPVVLTFIFMHCNSPATVIAAARTPLRVGDVPPKVILSDVGGSSVRVPIDFRGKVVILHFWTGGCSSCREEMPAMEELYRQYARKGLVVVAVNVGQRQDIVKKWVRDLRISYPVLIDSDREMADRYDVAGVPRTYVIGRKGKVRYKILGSTPVEILKKQVLSLL